VYYQYAILSQYTSTGTGDVGPARNWLPAMLLAVREVVTLARTWLLQQLRPSSTPMPSSTSTSASASIAASATALDTTPAATASAEGEARLLRAAFAFEQCAICGESIEFSPLSDDFVGEGGEGEEVGEKAATGGAAAAGVNGMSKLRYRTPFKEVGRSLLYGVCRTGCQVRWDRCCYSHLLITSNPAPAFATATEAPPEELERTSSVTGAGAPPLTSGTGGVMGNNGSGDIQATTLFGCSVCGSATNLAILSALQAHHLFDPFSPLCCPFCAVQMQPL
jgi:hypothetical protein